MVRGRSTGAYFDQHLDKYLDTTQLESWAQARGVERRDGAVTRVCALRCAALCCVALRDVWISAAVC